MEVIKTNSIKKANASSLIAGMNKEFFRKSLHISIAFVPSIANIAGVKFAVALLTLGILVYTFSEFFRLKGRVVPVISKITVLAMRERDANSFVLGPVTLALGAMLALMLYPEPAAMVGIYALAFGDGIASVAGKMFGTTKIPFTGGKSVEGSMACFVAVLLSCTALVPGMTLQNALVIASVATMLEALPIKDFDNLLLPAGTGLVAAILF